MPLLYGIEDRKIAAVIRYSKEETSMIDSRLDTFTIACVSTAEMNFNESCTSFLGNLSSRSDYYILVVGRNKKKNFVHVDIYLYLM